MSTLEGVTNPEQSQALNDLAKGVEQICEVCEYTDDSPGEPCSTCEDTGVIYPYGGISDWLKKKGQEWPSWVWVWDKNVSGPFLLGITSAIAFPTFVGPEQSYIHALDYLTAFAFLRQFEYIVSINLYGETWRDDDWRAVKDGDEIVATSPSELLDKMVEALKGVKDVI